MVKINDMVRTPQGDAIVIIKNRNGIIMLKLNEPPYSEIFVHKSIVANYEIVRRSQKIRASRIGFISDGPYKTAINSRPTPVYQTWRGMLGRAVETDIGDVLTVCEEWYDFQTFAAWYEQNRPNRPLFDVKWVLDYSLLVPGNTEYRPDACCVIPQQVSSAFVFRRQERALPMGVTQPNNGLWYSVHMGRQFIGQSRSLKDAQTMYWRAKIASIQKLTLEYWPCLPEPLAMRLIAFDMSDARLYFPEEFVNSC
jgi:hypothetical protein